MEIIPVMHAKNVITASIAIPEDPVVYAAPVRRKKRPAPSLLNLPNAGPSLKKVPGVQERQRLMDIAGNIPESKKQDWLSFIFIIAGGKH